MSTLPKTRDELLNALNMMEGQGATVDERKAFVDYVKSSRPEVSFSKPQESPIATTIKGLRDIGKSEEEINKIVSSGFTVPDFKGSLQKGVEGVKAGIKEAISPPEERETPQGQALGAFVDPLVGAGKGALKTARGGLELGLKTSHALGRVVASDAMEEKLGIQKGDAGQMAEKVIPKEITEAEGGFQKAGQFMEQVGEFALPLGAAKKYTAGASLFKRAVAEGLISGGVATAKSGEVGTDTAVSGALGFGIPLVGATGKAVLSKLFGKAALAKAAVGLPPSVVSRADKIVQSGIKVGGKTTKAYDSFDDFLIKEGFFKNGLKTTRSDMMQHAEELFKAASGSKEAVLKDILNKVPIKQIPKLMPLLDKMLKAYDDDLTRSQYHQINRYVQGINKGTIKKLTASQLDQIRALADDVLPRGAFSGMEPVKTKGLEDAITPLRNFIAGLDKTGQIQHDNIVKRVIGEMLGFSSKNNPMAMAIDKSGVGTIVRDLGAGVGGGVGASLIPGMQPLAPVLAVGGIAKVIADQPQVASALVNQMSKLTGNEIASQIIKQLPLWLESAVLEGATEMTSQPDFTGAKSQ